MTGDGYVDTTSLQEASARLLTDALSSVLKRLADVQDFIDDNSAWFASFSADGEHLLEWTSIHSEYCEIVERLLQVELQVLGCSEDALIEHAMRAVEDPVADELLTRLVAKTDYMRFVEMMHEEHVALPTRDDEEEYVEVEEFGQEEDAALGDEDEDEGLLEALLEHSASTMRIVER